MFARVFKIQGVSCESFSQLSTRRVLYALYTTPCRYVNQKSVCHDVLIISSYFILDWTYPMALMAVTRQWIKVAHCFIGMYSIGFAIQVPLIMSLTMKQQRHDIRWHEDVLASLMQEGLPVFGFRFVLDILYGGINIMWSSCGTIKTLLLLSVCWQGNWMVWMLSYIVFIIAEHVTWHSWQWQDLMWSKKWHTLSHWYVEHWNHKTSIINYWTLRWISQRHRDAVVILVLILGQVLWWVSISANLEKIMFFGDIQLHLMSIIWFRCQVSINCFDGRPPACFSFRCFMSTTRSSLYIFIQQGLSLSSRYSSSCILPLYEKDCQHSSFVWTVCSKGPGFCCKYITPLLQRWTTNVHIHKGGSLDQTTFCMLFRHCRHPTLSTHLRHTFCTLCLVFDAIQPYSITSCFFMSCMVTLLWQLLSTFDFGWISLK